MSLESNLSRRTFLKRSFVYGGVIGTGALLLTSGFKSLDILINHEQSLVQENCPKPPDEQLVEESKAAIDDLHKRVDIVRGDLDTLPESKDPTDMKSNYGIRDQARDTQDCQADILNKGWAGRQIPGMLTMVGVIIVGSSLGVMVAHSQNRQF